MLWASDRICPPPPLGPPSHPRASPDGAAAAIAFRREVHTIDPALLSREKAALLGKALHMSRQRVYDTAGELGIYLGQCDSHEEMELPRRSARDADVDEIMDRLKAGATFAEVSDEQGFCPKTLQNLLREVGIDSRHDIGWSDEEVPSWPTLRFSKQWRESSTFIWACMHACHNKMHD